jgi:SAM-dependent methyltransferase
MSTPEHWNTMYASRAPDELSWYQPLPALSLAMIERSGIERSAAILDVGGGASTLADALIDRGHESITVLDLSDAALSRARARLGERADRIIWIAADITAAGLASHSIDLWHDRAVFHFLCEPGDRQRYRESLL